MDMNAPFLPAGAFGLGTGLALAVLIGFGFGFVLERGGFGSSRRLAAQFYLYDMTVFKVMFTAILTAMVGLFALARVGWVDLDLVYVNPTHLWPQLVGGFLLGVGFLVSGYCPGTAIVAGASGKIDGMLAMLGVGGGIVLFGAAYQPWLETFHKSGDFGRLLLSDLFGVSPLFLAIEITVVAAGAFVFAEWVERRFARSAEPGRIPRWGRWAGPAVTGGLVAVAVLGFLLPQARNVPAVASPEEVVTPVELARHLVEGNGTWTLVDLRDSDAVGKGSIPGALAVPVSELASPSAWSDRLPEHRPVLLVDAGDGVAARVGAPASYHTAILAGGYPAWEKEILTPPDAAAAGDPEASERAALVSFFTGTASAAPAPVLAPRPAPAGGGKKAKPAGGCE
jgi:rhodanese-related sulfurtransferase/uncharacterized membrane protein YedE/YeeE